MALHGHDDPGSFHCSRCGCAVEEWRGQHGGRESEPELDMQETIEQAKRAFALRKYEQAVDHYATALELM